jgi:hypothetical protein
MTHTLIVHIPNEDAIVGEVEEFPAATDTIITIQNPRRKDGKDVHYLNNDVVTVIWPLSQVTFIEVLPGEGEERIIGFVRE